MVLTQSGFICCYFKTIFTCLLFLAHVTNARLQQKVTTIFFSMSCFKHKRTMHHHAWINQIFTRFLSYLFLFLFCFPNLLIHFLRFIYKYLSSIYLPSKYFLLLIVFISLEIVFFLCEFFSEAYSITHFFNLFSLSISLFSLFFHHNLLPH